MWKYSNFDLGYLNPSFFYHNLNNRSMFNALAYIEVNASLFKGFTLYGQYAMDQARAPHEGDSQSDAWGVSVGGEYTFSLGKSVFTAYSEYLLTSPLLYRRDGVDFIKVSRYYHQGSDNDTYGHIPFFEYIGYRYGGDTSKPDKETLHDTLRLISAPVLADNRRSRIFNGRNWRSDRSAPVIGNAKSTDDIISVRRGETIDGDFTKREDKLSKKDREADFKGAMKDFLSEINLLVGEAEEIILDRKLYGERYGQPGQLQEGRNMRRSAPEVPLSHLR